MRDVFILGLLGRSLSGKSTAAEYYRDRHGFTVVNLADGLKDVLQHVLGLSDAQVRGTLKDVVDLRWGGTPRDLMIRLGHGGRQILWQDVWVEACFYKIKHLRGEDPTRSLFVIGDVRYENECRAITRHGGVVLKLTRRVTNIPTEVSVDDVPASLIWRTVDNQDASADVLQSMLDCLSRPWKELP